LVTKYPPGIIAFLDYKQRDDKVTFAETIAYNVLLKIAPIFLIIGEATEGPFVIKEYRGGNFRPEPPECDLLKIKEVQDWQELGEWERQLRQDYKEKHSEPIVNILKQD